MLIQAVGVDAVGGDWLLLSSRQLPYRCPHILGVHPPVELLQAGPVILYNLLANPSRDCIRFFDAASSHKLILLAQQRLDKWRNVFRITRLNGDRFLRIELIQESECDVIEVNNYRTLDKIAVAMKWIFLTVNYIFRKISRQLNCMQFLAIFRENSWKIAKHLAILREVSRKMTLTIPYAVMLDTLAICKIISYFEIKC